jgi:hypothetical protein
LSGTDNMKMSFLSGTDNIKMLTKKRDRKQEDSARKLKRQARGADFITYDFSENWKKELKQIFDTKGYVFIRDVIDGFASSLLDQLIIEKMKDRGRSTIMGETFVINCSAKKNKTIFATIYDKMQPIIMHLLSLLYENEDLLSNTVVLQQVGLMLKEANNPSAQLPHADSMGNDIRLLLYTR